MEKIVSPWETPFITKLGSWLCKKGHYGHGLFLIHGCHLALKMKYQLKLKWKDILNEDGTVKDVLVIEGLDDRAINDLIKLSTKLVYNALGNPNMDALLYINEHNKKPLVTNTLNRELAKHGKAYKQELMPIIDKAANGNYNHQIIQRLYGSVLKIGDYPLTTAHLEIAWAKDYVRYNNYSIRSFRRASRIMKHTSLQQTFDAIGRGPNEIEDITPRYDYCGDIEDIGNKDSIKYLSEIKYK